MGDKIGRLWRRYRFEVEMGIMMVLCLTVGTMQMYAVFDRADGARLFNEAGGCWSAAPAQSIVVALGGMTGAERDAMLAAARLCRDNPASRQPEDIARLMERLLDRADMAVRPLPEDLRGDAASKARQAMDGSQAE